MAKNRFNPPKGARSERVNSAAMRPGATALRLAGGPGLAPAKGLACACEWPSARFSAGALEALKWVALLAMTVDHVNKYLFDWTHPWMFAVGRTALPLFALVLAYKLSQAVPAARAAVAGRVAVRLLVAGLVATVPFIAAGHIQYSWWWPLNVLFTLAAGAGVVWAMETRRWAVAGALFIGAGALAEFFWPGLLLFVAGYRFFKRPTPLSLLGMSLGMAGLSAINGTHWAFAGVAIFFLAQWLPKGLALPRSKWLFYAYYPGHLAALVGLQALMGAAR